MSVIEREYHLTPQERFIEDVTWMAARTGVKPSEQFNVEVNDRIREEAKKAFLAGEFRKCMRILRIPNSRNPASGWRWLNQITGLMKQKGVKLRPASAESVATLRRSNSRDQSAVLQP